MSLPDIHRSVLDNLSDGVLAVGPGGRIEMLNPAAERILGLEPGEAQGRGFAELLIAHEGFDDLTQLVIDATLARSGGERRVVEVQRDGVDRSLSVATSYLWMPRRDGATKAVAVIAVFSDISELRELRDNELRMAKAAQAQHARLQDAYREIEERNAALAAALRKVRVVQGLGFVLVVALFLGVGLWSWRPADLFERVGLAGSGAQATAGPAGEPDRLTVAPRPVSTRMTLKGRLTPWRTVEVRSAVAGTVAAVRYAVGDAVTEGQVLLELDLSKLADRYQRERLRHAKERKQFETLSAWEDSPDMLRARRSFAKATLGMESQRNRMKKTTFLFERGLIAAVEYEDAVREDRSQQLDFEAAREEFEEVRARVGEEEVAAARSAMESALAELRALEEALEGDRVLAPLSGVVLAPARAGKEPVAGAPVREGEVLLTIGDFSRLAVVTQVDEADVGTLEVGQQVTVTGNAFRGLRLNGAVTHVAGEADPKARGIPKFDVTVTLDPLGPGEAARIRSGMSAQLSIVTYSNPKALLVPIDAVASRGGTHRLRVLDPATGEVQEREVEIGPTTRSSVEIRAGLDAGETILLPQG